MEVEQAALPPYPTGWLPFGLASPILEARGSRTGRTDSASLAAPPHKGKPLCNGGLGAEPPVVASVL